MFNLFFIVLLFQIRLDGVPDCSQWILIDPVAKGEELITLLVQAVEQECECGFTRDHITDDAFQCFPESQQHVTFRARLAELSQATSPPLITHIEQWVSSTQFISIQSVRFSIDSACTVVITEFGSRECSEEQPTTTTTPQRTTTNPSTSESFTFNPGTATAAVPVGLIVGVILIVLLVCGVGVTIIITVVVVVLRRQRAHKKHPR